MLPSTVSIMFDLTLTSHWSSVWIVSLPLLLMSVVPAFVSMSVFPALTLTV
jgi:hypothetical protein